MGNGTKVALVALLILMVVVIARFVRRDAAPERKARPATTATAGPAGAPAKTGVSGKAVASPASKPGAPLAKDVRTQTAPSPAKASATPPPSGAVTPPSLARSEPRPLGSAPRSADEPMSPPAGATVRAADPPSAASSAETRPAPSLTGDVAKPAPAISPAPGGGPEPPASTRWEERNAGLAAAASPSGTLEPSPRPPQPKFSDGTFGAPPAGPSPGTGSAVALDPSSKSVVIGTSAPPPSPPAGRAEPPSPSTAPPGSGVTGGTPGFPKTHKIQDGDTYYKIAKAEYGSADPRLLAHIQRANPGLDPARLPVGKEISIPAPPADWKPPASRSPGTSSGPAPAPRPALGGAALPGEAKSAPAPSGPAKLPLRYLVQRGDTLGKLARRFYGDPNKFHAIADANEDLKYGGELIAGTTITIPALR